MGKRCWWVSVGLVWRSTTTLTSTSCDVVSKKTCLSFKTSAVNLIVGCVVGCPLIGLFPSDVNAKVCMYSYKCKGTDLRTHGSRNLIHTQTSTALRTDGRTNEQTRNQRDA